MKKAYWRRGHATRLVNWCTRLAGKSIRPDTIFRGRRLTAADLEGVPVGVSATPMGATLAAQAGFEQREEVRFRQSAVPGASEKVDVALWIGVRPPSSSPASGASTVASDSPIPEMRGL